MADYEVRGLRTRAKCTQDIAPGLRSSSLTSMSFLSFPVKNPALLWSAFLYTLLVASFSAFVSYTVRLTDKYFKFIQAGLENFKHC